MKNMANKIINVLIVDDEQIVREGLRYMTGTPWDFVSAGKPPTEKMPWK